MARTLSKLQVAYADFFTAMLDQYEVTSPAKLSKEKKTEFFNRIKKEWPKAKRKVTQEGTLKATEKKIIIDEVVLRKTIQEEILNILTEAKAPKTFTVPKTLRIRDTTLPAGKYTYTGDKFGSLTYKTPGHINLVSIKSYDLDDLISQKKIKV